MGVYAGAVTTLVGLALLVSHTLNSTTWALLDMAFLLVVLWVVLGGVFQERSRDRVRQLVLRWRWGWRIKFVLMATALVLVEEAITTSLTNLAPAFGSTPFGCAHHGLDELPAGDRVLETPSSITAHAMSEGIHRRKREPRLGMPGCTDPRGGRLASRDRGIGSQALPAADEQKEGPELHDEPTVGEGVSTYDRRVVESNHPYPCAERESSTRSGPRRDGRAGHHQNPHHYQLEDPEEGRVRPTSLRGARRDLTHRDREEIRDFPCRPSPGPAGP